MNDADASKILCLYFTDKEPITLAPVKVIDRRVRCLRLDTRQRNMAFYTVMRYSG